jgi:hypothetical protein
MPNNRNTNHNFNDLNRLPSGICICLNTIDPLDRIQSIIIIEKNNTNLRESPVPHSDAHASNKLDPY